MELTATEPGPSVLERQSKPLEYDERVFAEWENQRSHRLYVLNTGVGSISIRQAKVIEELESPIDDYLFWSCTVSSG